MSRIARVVVPGMSHHITQRGVRRLDVFRDEEDRLLYLRLFAQGAHAHQLTIHSYALMSNHVLCGAPHKTCNGESIFMRSPLARTPLASYADAFELRIKERVVKDAISLSVALKRPDRSLGATTDSSDSSFTVGSARTYISVV
jgi:REP element-mobilizing transposase RayT